MRPGARPEDDYGFPEEGGSDGNKMSRRIFLAATGLAGVKVLEGGFPKRPAGDGILGAGIADDVRRMEQNGDPVEAPIEWAIQEGDRPRSCLRPGYLNTTPLFDLDTLDARVEEGERAYDFDVDVDLRFVEGSYEEAVQNVHENPHLSDEVEARNLQGNPARGDIFAYHNEFNHRGGNFWTSDKTGVTVADSPDTLEEFIGDTPAEFMAAFAYAVIEDGEVGKGHPYWNPGSALIDTIDTDHWAEQYEGLEPGSYEITFNLKPGEGGSREETHSLHYTGEIDDVARQFRPVTTELMGAAEDTVDDYI